MRRTSSCAAGLALLLALACDGGTIICPEELDCEHTAEVGYSEPIGVPYDLSIELDEPVTLRCNDPDSLEATENPEHVTCTGSGFEILGDDANQSTIRVTIVEVDSGDARAVNELVQLTIPPDQVPGDEDCPTCYDRDGNLMLL